jgi:hypothetical protein
MTVLTRAARRDPQDVQGCRVWYVYVELIGSRSTAAAALACRMQHAGARVCVARAPANALVFLEPPIVVEKADMPWNQNLSDFDSSATTESEAQTAETTPRAWWLSNADRTEYRRE